MNNQLDERGLPLQQCNCETCEYKKQATECLCKSCKVNPCKKEKKSATKSTLFAQIFCAIWIGVWCTFKFVHDGIENIEVNDIIFAGLGVVGCFSPVFINMFFDKVQNIKYNNMY